MTRPLSNDAHSTSLLSCPALYVSEAVRIRLAPPPPQMLTRRPGVHEQECYRDGAGRYRPTTARVESIGRASTVIPLPVTDVALRMEL